MSVGVPAYNKLAQTTEEAQTKVENTQLSNQTKTTNKQERKRRKKTDLCAWRAAWQQGQGLPEACHPGGDPHTSQEEGGRHHCEGERRPCGTLQGLWQVQLPHHQTGLWWSHGHLGGRQEKDKRLLGWGIGDYWIVKMGDIVVVVCWLLNVPATG